MKNITFFTSLISLIFLNSCVKTLEAPELINEEELITTLVVTLESATDQIELRYTDLDGDGPNQGVFQAPNLKPNTTYSGKLQFLNESESPAEDITLEIEEESNDHQVFYVVNGLNATIEPVNIDLNGYYLGTTFSLTTLSVSEGQLQFILRHLPTKPNDGNPATAGGATDLSVIFNLKITE